MPLRRPSQATLKFANRWGGARKGAGRKPGKLRRDQHRPRARIDRRQPVHVTLRLADAERDLRIEPVHQAVRRVLAAMREARSDFRVVHYSLQHNHLHLIAEADSGPAWKSGIRSLCIRAAKQINVALGRSGRLFSDRYHRRDLATPFEVRRAYAYVLLNRRRHLEQWGRDPGADVLDHYGSGATFDGWDRPVIEDMSESVVATARTWLAASGWKRRGRIDPGEIPGVAATRRTHARIRRDA
jgi:REP element-mobilizing transposase RayT